MKTILILLLLLPASLMAQDKYYTKSGKASFYSVASENIEATNKSVTSIIDSKTGKIEFSMLIRSFEFEKALMEEHFNENYMESEKYPKATFSGTIAKIEDVDFSKDGVYTVSVEGKLTIHNVSKEITQSAKITVKDGKISAKCDFKIKLKDYGIEDSKIGKNIAEEIEIKISIAEYQILKK